MIKERAVNHFTGKNGYNRLNCAQTILEIFKHRVDFISDKTISDFENMGVGNAPGGECGMVYAAKYILENSGKSGDIVEFEDFFTDNAGSLQCIDIKKKKRDFCALCIKETAEYMDSKFD